MVVLDSSAAVDYLLSLDERGAWVRSQLSESGTAIAPHLLDLEVTSFLRREVIRMKLSEARATEALVDLASMRVVRYAHRNLLPRIWELRDVLTPYEASFVALAENTGLPLLTTDLHLARSHGHRVGILKVVSSFTLESTDGAARSGVIRTAHGEIRTPAFMPVGTKATVKSLHPDEVRELGADVILGNTYHLHFRPGEELIEELGGIHAFSGWEGPILTDSGGFQVFSLRDTLLGVDDDGVTFRSVYDGTAERFTPERVAEIQRRLGSDIAMCLDICPPADATWEHHEEAVRRTQAWAERQVDAPRATGQLRFGIAQGGIHRDLRERSIEGITALPFDGYALGGLAVGESKVEMFETVDWAAELMPSTYPRYFMGIGDAEGILEVIARGIDMFDCVLPTRTARTGSALTKHGRLNLRNARFARDGRPLEADCDCPACSRFSRAFIRHLVTQQEMLGLRLLSLHNLAFTLRLTEGARAAIRQGTFAAYRAEALAQLANPPEEDV